MANNHHATTNAIDIIDHMLPSDTHNTYDVIFFGATILTTVTHDPAVAAGWISEIESFHSHRLSHLIVGLDVEWRPSYSRIQNPAATLQLCVGQKCLIYQLIHSPYVPKCLIDFLANRNYTFVGVGVKADVEKLEEDYEFGFNTNTVDLRGIAAAEYGRRDLNNAGVKELVRVVLGKEMEKPKRITMSKWDNQWLYPAQVQYACIDAFVCFEIGRILNASSAPSASSTATAAAAMANHHHGTKTIDIIDHMLPSDTHNTYDVIFFGDTILTTVTHHPGVAAAWISEIESRRHLIVGLDVEWRPYGRNPVATLQLCVGRRCLIYQLIHSPSVPKSLVDFLANPNYTFVGVGVKEDMEKLKKDYEFGFNTNTVDLGGLAAAEYGRMELKKANLKELVRVVLGKEMEKPEWVRMSAWDNKSLYPDQVLYACIDAFVSFEIGRILNASSSASRIARRGFFDKSLGTGSGSAGHFGSPGTGSGSAGRSVDTSLTSDNHTNTAVVAGIATFAVAAAAGLYWLSSKEKMTKIIELNLEEVAGVRTE